MNLHTQRLLIRPILPEDWQGLKKVTRDFAASQYWMYDYPFPAEDEKLKQIAVHFSQTGTFLSVLLQGTGEMIGYISCHDDGASYDIGYCFHSDFHRKGYAFEAISALMDALTEQKHITRFTAGTALNNFPSLSLLRKLGFQLISTEATSFHKDADGNDIIFEGGWFVRNVPPHFFKENL